MFERFAHRLIVEQQRCSDYAAVAAEMPQPELVAEHHGLRRIESTLVRREEAPDERCDAEQREERLRNGHAGEPLGFSGTSQTQVTGSVEGEVPGDVG